MGLAAPTPRSRTNTWCTRWAASRRTTQTGEPYSALAPRPGSSPQETSSPMLVSIHLMGMGAVAYRLQCNTWLDERLFTQTPTCSASRISLALAACTISDSRTLQPTSSKYALPIRDLASHIVSTLAVFTRVFTTLIQIDCVQPTACVHHDRIYRVELNRLTVP